MQIGRIEQLTDNAGPQVSDPVVAEVIEMLAKRSATGILKYNNTLARTDIDLEGWMEHAIEEQMDNLLYLVRALMEVRNIKHRAEMRESIEVRELLDLL